MVLDQDRPAPFEHSINDEMEYTAICQKIDRAHPEDIRTLAKELARYAFCVQRGAIRELARKAAAGETVKFKFGSE
ncbi:hypothetical protein [Synechococcus elongatus]|uniref:hypothetical protein n=1 Tax=Synechococcus elongatus TaxID=32046 RepID=UPI000F7F7D46|nr:hypothetical protein [Synechococcus elongatus]